MKQLELTGPEFDAVLAALRMLANNMDGSTIEARCVDFDVIRTNADSHAGLTAEEVWLLGDRLVSPESATRVGCEV